MRETGVDKTRYVLVTAAHNEEAFIETTILSIVLQTLPPAEWVIVDDASTDRTAEIVRIYACEHSFIHLLRLPGGHPPDFAAQVHAINAGLNLLKATAYEFVGNVDADISFVPSYFERLLEKFRGNVNLGLAGGFLQEKEGARFKLRSGNTSGSVPHGIQFFRRECFQAVQGYAPFKYGAPDWHAEVCARMKGWHVRAFPDLKAFHHRSTGSVSGLVNYFYRSGLSAYSLGSDPLFEILKSLHRFKERPRIVGGLARLAGFATGYLQGEQREASHQFMEFLRQEQRERLFLVFRNALTRSRRSPASLDTSELPRERTSP